MHWIVQIKIQERCIGWCKLKYKKDALDGAN